MNEKELTRVDLRNTLRDGLVETINIGFYALKSGKKRVTMKHFEWKRVGCAVVLLVLLAALAGIGYVADHYQENVTVEAGEVLTVSDVWTGAGNAVLPDVSGVDTSRPGVYRTDVLLFGSLDVPVTVTVQDTTAPAVETQDLIRRMGENCEPADFIASWTDVTAVTFSFVKEPDMQLMGDQTIEILAADESGNETAVTANLFIPSVREKAESEIGAELPAAEAFLLSEASKAEYVTDISKIDNLKLGTNQVKILVDGMEYEVALEIVDTTAPVAAVHDKTGWVNKTLTADAFVDEIQDMTQVTVGFKAEPDWASQGQQEVVLTFTDEGGNVAEYPVTLSLEADTVGPIINASDITVKVGKNISYKKSISMTDNCDAAEDLELKIDSAEVNLKAVGDYKVYCTATDTSGNKTEKVITVHVVPEKVLTYEQAEIDQMADAVLAKILTPDMTPDQKCRAIHDWVKKNVSYINNSEKGNWLRGAYEGFKLHKGDCYVYYATSRALLTRAGIANMEIKKEKEAWTSQSNHYWNLVNLGSGWYHFDTTPRKDKTVFYMWTDAQMKEYSDTHKGSHNFTRALYPAIN